MTSQRSPEAELRSRLRHDLPPAAFEPCPSRVLWFVPLVAVAVGGVASVAVTSMPWPVKAVIGVVIGQALAAMGFLAHETLHGATVSSRRVQDLCGYLGFGPMLVSPHLWRIWHNQVHHNNTNMGNADPDGFGTLSRYERMPSTRFVARLAPGSGHWSSWFFLGYWFAFHGQVVLWIQSRFMRGFTSLNRRRAIVDTLVSLAAWVALGWWVGPVNSIFVILIPFVTANATVMSYISTNHFMRPHAETNNPLENSMSVTTFPTIDRLHFNFSHHVEHHLFPRMSGKHAPLVRSWLRDNEPDAYVAPSHAVALRELYRTPRVYRDANTLCDPDDPTRAVPIAAVTAALR